MEIEAKFSVPDRDTFDQLRQLTELAGYRVVASGVKSVYDRYLDTENRAILRAGYACRVRRESNEEELYVATLKGLGGADADSGIHQREEHEVQVGGVDPLTWPDSPARDLAVQLSGGWPLLELFSLSQERHICLLCDEGAVETRHVVELSLDVVTVGGDASGPYYEVELELLEQGNRPDLNTLSSSLREEWALRPETRSKFERGLALMDAAAQVDREEMGVDGPLTAEEYAVLQTWAKTGNPPEQRRARITMLHDEGYGTSAIAAKVDLSPRQVRRWLAAFRAQRMAMFLAGAGAEQRDEDGPTVQVEPSMVIVQAVPDSVGAPDEAAQREELVQSTPLTVEELRALYDEDPASDGYVKNMASSLFDVTSKVHGLAPDRKALLAAAAILRGIGRTQDRDRYHLASRDLILAQPIVGFDGFEQDMLASIIAFHRKKVRRRREEAFLRLSPVLQQETLALAALLRMAAALDTLGTQSTVVSRVEAQNTRITVIVEGPMAELDGAEAQRHSGLWDQLFDVGLRFLTEGQLIQAPVVIDFDAESLVVPELISPGLLPEDPMSEAGRKTLWFHFVRMLKHEPGTRIGDDIEELHDMRVATRRMRAAVRVFGDFFQPEAIRPFNKEIRRVTRALGPVRDLDVFEEKAARYLQILPQESRGGLDPLLETWQAGRGDAREEMLAFLDSDRYQRFKREFAVFLQTEGAGALPVPRDRPVPYQVRHVAPRLIYTRYETVRAYETVLEGAQIETLHALRIDCKYLRYTLEFLREVLGPDGDAVIKEVKAMQDHLGDLNDAEVAIELLNDFLSGWDAAQTHVPLSQRRSGVGIVTYLASRHAEKHRLLVTFPEAWAKLNRVQVRRWLALAVAAL